MTSKNSNWQKALLCCIMSNDIQVPKLNNKKSLTIIFCSVASMFVSKFVLLFKDCGMPMTYYMGGGKRLRVAFISKDKKNSSLQLGHTKRWFQRIFWDSSLLPNEPCGNCGVWHLYCFQCLQVKSKFILEMRSVFTAEYGMNQFICLFLNVSTGL